MSSTGGKSTQRARTGEIIDRATAKTGLTDFGPDTWKEGLEVLVRAAETEARLNDLGEEAFYSALVRPLVNRLQIEDWYRRHPEIDDQDVEVELLGVGFPRTGTTALSHMLGEDVRFRCLRMWEASAPCPPSGMSQKDDEDRVAAAEAAVTMVHNYTAERLRSMLPRTGTGPYEDHDLMALDFRSQVFLVSAHIPSYADWFVHCDMEPTYRYEKRVLKLLQWKTAAKTWRLKSPTHTLFLEAYEKVFPDARFVQTHRDVSKVLPSVSDLYYTMLQAGNSDVDPKYVGQLNMEQWGIALDRCLAFRRDAARDARFFDLGFTQFQTDPIAEVAKLYAWLGDSLSAGTIDKMRAWRADNPKDKHGRHEYNGLDFGITEQSLNERFGTYRQRFAPYLG